MNALMLSLASASQPLLRRVAEKDREAVPFTIDGEAASALVGDTVLTAMLTQVGRLRRNEFSGEARAGFCMMGACQDCWVETVDGARLRACSTFIEPGMALMTGASGAVDVAGGAPP